MVNGKKLVNILFILVGIFFYNCLSIAMEKPYHHLPDGTFRNPEGSPKRDPNVKWSYKIFNQEKKKLDMTVPKEHVVEKEKVLSIEKQLKEEEQCDLIVCLSHLGYDYDYPEKPCDTQLAQKTFHTDLIIGGHTHTFLDKPDVRTNQNGNSVLVNQVGCYGINLGRIDFYFDSAKKASANGVSITV